MLLFGPESHAKAFSRQVGVEVGSGRLARSTRAGLEESGASVPPLMAGDVLRLVIASARPHGYKHMCYRSGVIFKRSKEGIMDRPPGPIKIRPRPKPQP